jgi:hypothetical protein
MPKKMISGPPDHSLSDELDGSREEIVTSGGQLT